MWQRRMRVQVPVLVAAALFSWNCGERVRSNVPTATTEPLNRWIVSIAPADAGTAAASASAQRSDKKKPRCQPELRFTMAFYSPSDARTTIVDESATLGS